MTCQKLSDAESLRATVEANMADSCRILSKTVVQADDGEMSATYTAGSLTKCRWATGTAIEQAAGALFQAVTTHSVILPVGTVVTRHDRIRLALVGGLVAQPALEGAVNGEPLPGVGCLKVSLREVVAVDG